MKIIAKFLPTLFALLLLTSGLHAQNFFSPAGRDKALPKAVDVTKNIRKMDVLRLDETALRKYLAKAPVEFQDKGKVLPLEIPLPDGRTEVFGLVESSILSPEIAAQHPEIKSYTGNGLTHKTAVIRLTLTSAGFHAVVLDLDGEEIYFEHYSQEDKDVYFNYFVRDAVSPPDYQKGRCGIEMDGKIKEHIHDHSDLDKNNTGGTLRTFRLAMAANGEFTGQHGGTQASAFAVIVNYVATINLVYRRELSVHLNLVSGTNLIYTNAATDPYTNSDQGMMLDENQANCDAVIGNANYDVGHVWGYEGNNSGGGLASFQSVCNNSFKAQGASGEGGPPYAQVFFDQLVLHEMGHQFGMSHSYNSTIPVCTTRNPATSVEPGAGATIMSYGFTCGTDDYFTSTTSGPFLNFHTVSYDQAEAYISSISCQTNSATGNTPPVVTMPSSFTIPKSTPFSLTGSADAPGAGDSYTYSWEGTDIGTMVPNAGTLDDTTQPPFFRSYEPSASGATRTFPILSSILDGTNQAKGDKLPSVSTATNLRLSVRDNNTAGGGLSYGQVTINVDGNIGPFLETTNLAGTYPASSNQTITWSVNGTNVATPNINILLSADGGLTFPFSLAAKTPNDGSQMITLPNIQTTTARIKVEAVGNVFFDISNTNFTISISGCTAAISNICPTGAMTLNQGDPGLNLGLNGYYGSSLTQHDFNLTAGSPTGELANATAQNGTTCQTAWGVENYEVLDFAVSSTGNYTFSDATNSISYAVFLSAGYNPANPCSGTFVGSNSWDAIQWSHPGLYH
ncbi:MAG: zinc-dependent metalloprotease family protein [Saprospiraceae bacterium]